MPSKILIVTPIYQRGGSGAATYYKLLTSWLQSENHFPVIISEAPSTRSVKYGLWPVRSGISKNKWRDLLAYGVQKSYILFFALYFSMGETKKNYFAFELFLIIRIL